MLADRAFPRRVATVLLPVILVATGLFASVSVQAGVAPATADPAPDLRFVPDYTQAPYTGLPISPGLGPTYGETWCAAPAAGTNIANQQGTPLALIPYEAFGCLLEQFKTEAAIAGVQPRMTYSVLTQTDAGRDQYGVIVNAMETPEQIEGYNNWLAYRAKALTDPHAAQALLESFTNVKIPIFMENNIHGDEEEGADSMMQVIRDLVTLPRGTNATVDNFLDHAILVTIPSMNPDGRFNGQRANQNGFDMNRDWLVQSQAEVRANLKLQVQWLAPVMLATHGYVNPSLVDGLTKPHNPGLEYDVFLYWNQRRLDENQNAFARIGQGITRPVNGPMPNPVNATLSRGFCASSASPANNVCGTGGILAGNGLTQVGNTVTVTTPVITAAPIKVADTVVIAGAGVGGYNGGPFRVDSVISPNQFTYEAPTSGLADSGGNSYLIAASPGGLSKSGTTVTVTTATASNVVAGDSVVIANAEVGGYNGTCTNAIVIDSTQFTCTAANATVQVASGGGAVSVGAAVGTVQVQTGPNQAEGWDDLGPFYTQTYGAFFGVDGSTLEMCSSSCAAPFTGRLGGKTVQYVGFWSSADYWISNRDAMLKDQVKIFVRGADDAERPNCCDDPLVAGRGFTEAEHDWMTPYPKAYVIPVHGGGQRSDAEANRMAQWLLDNGITLHRATADFTWNGTTYPAGSYVVPMDQPMRGLAFTALGPGVDYSVRIGQLYAPPGGWSHGLMWGADTVEVPHGDATFTPATEVITAVDPLSGGVAAGASDWYSVSIKGVREQQVVLDLLRDGVYGEIAEAEFVSTSGGPTPAGSLIFPNDPATVAALEAAGDAAGVTFQRNVAVVKPPTTRLSEAPKIGILVNSANPAINDSVFSLRRIFGSDAVFVSVVTGPNSLQNAVDDPLLGIDVLYNIGQGYPAIANATARARINAFFARGGGYIATTQNGNNLSFMTGASPALVTGAFTAGSAAAGGGTGVWVNVGGSGSVLTSAMPASDYIYLPSNVTYFSAIPAGAIVDGQYRPDMSNGAPRGPSPGYVAGLWLNRTSAASVATNDAPLLIHGLTTASSRYTGLATNPFSRSDYERIWGWVVQSALWSDLTDEALLDQTITADTLTDKVWGNADFPIMATSTSGRTVSLAASGQCTIDSPYSPAMIHITAAGSCTITASHPGDGNYNPADDVVQTITIAQAAASATYTGDPMAFLPTAAATTATILLQATAIDTALAAGAPDSGLGDIRTATVSFMEGATSLCGPLPVASIGASLAAGAANCSVPLGAGTHTIDIVVDGNYTGTSQATVIVTNAVKGTASELIGEGEFVFSNSSSAGMYAADAGSTGKFQLAGQLDTKGPKGSAALTYTAGPKTYRIEMTSLQVLGKGRQAGGTNCDKAPSATCAGLGYLRGTASLLDPTTKKPTTIGTGFTVQVVLTDRGKGTTDSIGFTLWDGTTLLFSSEWDGAVTRELTLTKGNLAAN